jgi:lia operon protein LiaI
MKPGGKSALAIILIGCGALILLDKIGWGLGHLMGLIIPLAMLAFGYIGWANGRKWIGGILMFLGAIILLGKISGLIGLIAAITMIWWGVTMLKRRRAY